MEKTFHTEGYQIFVGLMRDLRKEAGVTQIEMGERLDLPQAVVSKWERGQRRIDVLELRLWCQALDISPPTFMRRLEKRLD